MPPASGDRDQSARGRIARHGREQSEEIARFAELQTDPRLRELLIRQVAQLWAEADADRAMAWVMSLPDSPERVATLIDVSLTVALSDPQRAVSLREPEVGNVEPDGVLEGLVQQWAQRGLRRGARVGEHTATRCAARQTTPAAAGVRTRRERGAGSAPRLVDAAFEDGSQKAEAVAIVAPRWTQADPAAANAWLQGLDEATARPALKELHPPQ